MSRRIISFSVALYLMVISGVVWPKGSGDRERESGSTKNDEISYSFSVNPVYTFSAGLTLGLAWLAVRFFLDQPLAEEDDAGVPDDQGSVERLEDREAKEGGGRSRVSFFSWGRSAYRSSFSCESRCLAKKKYDFSNALGAITLRYPQLIGFLQNIEAVPEDIVLFLEPGVHEGRWQVSYISAPLLSEVLAAFPRSVGVTVVSESAYVNDLNEVRYTYFERVLAHNILSIQNGINVAFLNQQERQLVFGYIDSVPEQISQSMHLIRQRLDEYMPGVEQFNYIFAIGAFSFIVSNPKNSWALPLLKPMLLKYLAALRSNGLFFIDFEMYKYFRDNYFQTLPIVTIFDVGVQSFVWCPQQSDIYCFNISFLLFTNQSRAFGEPFIQFSDSLINRSGEVFHGYRSDDLVVMEKMKRVKE